LSLWVHDDSASYRPRSVRGAAASRRSGAPGGEHRRRRYGTLPDTWM
jgi:hypothetical protein